MTKTPAAALAAAALLVVGGAAWVVLGKGPDTPSPPPPPDPPPAAADPTPAPPVPPATPPRPLTLEEKEQHLLELEKEEERRKKEDDARFKKVFAAKEETLARVLGSTRTNCDLQDMPFTDAVTYFSERHGVKLTIDDAVLEEVKDVKLTMRFKDTTLTHVVAVMAALAGVEAVPEDKGVRFRRAP
jgi:hypothetical protein